VYSVQLSHTGTLSIASLADDGRIKRKRPSGFPPERYVTFTTLGGVTHYFKALGTFNSGTDLICTPPSDCRKVVKPREYLNYPYI
jgi:hypothetical protein